MTTQITISDNNKPARCCSCSKKYEHTQRIAITESEDNYHYKTIIKGTYCTVCGAVVKSYIVNKVAKL